MTNAFESAARPRSLPVAILMGTALFAIVLPALDGLLIVLFRDRAPFSSGADWARFGAALAPVGACVGAAWYRLVQMRPGWARSFLAGFLFSVVLAADPEPFAERPLGPWLLHMLLVSLATGLVIGPIFHWLAFRSRPHSTR